MKIEWKKEYELGFEVIDQQHKEFVKAIQDLVELAKERKDGETMDRIFSSLERYAFEHFSLEERYFEEFNYAGAAEHIMAHDMFFERLQEFKREYQAGEVTIEQMLEFFEAWLTSHILEVDKKYVQCFKEHGLV